jgi:SNF2 family DNA or RNA helicase
MNLTDYHAKYFAHELTRRCPPDSAEKLAGAVASAQVDLNPHQVDTALFAFKSPLSKGALLADEVGLGKTIEAGLVLSQKWAERKRRILVITPANLRQQVSGVGREVLPALPRSRSQVLQRRRQARSVPPLRGAGDYHLLLPVREEQSNRCSCRSMGYGGDRRSAPLA